MALTPRLELPYPEGSDAPPDVPAWMEPMATILDKAVLSDKGTLAARPAANAVPQGFEYFTTDTNVTYLSDGATWFVVGKRPDGDINISELATDGDGLLAEACIITGSQTVATVTPTVIDYDSETLDVSSRFDLGTNRYTPQVKGMYNVGIHAVGTLDGAAVNQRLLLRLFKNGSECNSGVLAAPMSFGLTHLVAELRLLVLMNGTTDYLFAQIAHATADSVEYIETRFEAHLVGRIA